MSTLVATSTRPAGAAEDQRRFGPGFTLAAAVLGFVVVTLDAVVVNVALPAIRADLGGGITGLQWVVDGYTGAWFRHALALPEGRVRAGGVERDVRIEQADDTAQDAIDAAYRSKYARYGSAYVHPMVGPDAAAATFRLLPR